MVIIIIITIIIIFIMIIIIIITYVWVMGTREQVPQWNLSNNEGRSKMLHLLLKISPENMSMGIMVLKV